jgi:hypothetical protein
VAAEESKLTIADLNAYRQALEGKLGGPAVPVGFRELWSHPEAYQGKRVRVEGKVVRVFRQDRFGAFPPLGEYWVVTPAGNPFCLVYPSQGDKAQPAIGDRVRFVGVFLKRLSYQAADGERLAPLVVGDGRPVVVSSDVARHSSTPGLDLLDVTVGLVAVALVALVLVARHVRAPVRRVLELDVNEPPPEFLGPDDERPADDGPSALE